MEKDQREKKNLKNPPEEGTNTNDGPMATETTEREETIQPHELPSADLPVTDRHTSSNDFNSETEEELDDFTGIEDMDMSELVSYLMSPLNLPVEARDDEIETFNFETILKDKIYQDGGDIDFISIFDDESFDEG